MKQETGFTLVELVLVVVLILILIAILVPMHHGHGDKANRAVCATHLKSIDIACYLYANEHQDKYPIGWRHDNDGTGEWTTGGEVTPEDSFALLVHEDLVPLGLLICPAVGGEPAADEWELVGIGGPYDGDPGAAAEAYIHYAYQDIGVGDGANYTAGPSLKGSWPVFADRGVRKDPGKGNYELTGKASANHREKPQCQNIVGGAHGVTKEYTDSNGTCLVGYINGTLGDNIYTDTKGEMDTYLLSSKAQAGRSNAE